MTRTNTSETNLAAGEFAKQTQTPLKDAPRPEGAGALSRLLGIWGVFAVCAPCFGAADRLPAATIAHAATSAPLSTESVVADDALVVVTNGHVRLARRPDDVAIAVDGELDEAAWEGLRVHSDFRVIDPDTLVPATLATELRMFYTDRGFYLGVVMAQPPETLVEYLSGRDQYLPRDFFSITLDTSGEGRYGFWFSLSLGNSVSDGTILPERQYSSSWDGAWRGATARTATGWSAEYFIPWALVNMPKAEGARTVGIFAQRNVAHADERHAWPPLPWTKPKFLSAFAPLELQGVSPRQQYGVTPYVASVQHFAGAAGDSGDVKAGLDLFWRPSSNFQLASTLNPDFGNVEADDVVINLTNYETFFPEKRLFFQEGQEIFAVGDTYKRPVTLLHTRRIGAPPVRPDVPAGVRLASEDLHRPADLLGALKATGQQGALRYGFLGVLEDDARFTAWQGDERVTLRQDGRGFGAVRLLYEQSNGGYRALGLLSTAMRHPSRNAQVHAVDGQYHTAGGKLRLSTLIVASDITGGAEDGQGGTLDLSYTPRQGLSHALSLDAFDDTIQLNDMGYQSRNDYRRASYRLRVSSPNTARFRNTRTYVRLGRMWNGAGEVIDSGVSVDQALTLRNFAQVRFEVGYRPARHDDRGSFGNGTYRVGEAWDAEVRFESDASRRLAYSLRQRWQQEPVGGLYQRTQGNVRWRPTDRFTLAFGLRYADRDGWLLHQSRGDFATFAAEQVDSNLDLAYFFTARQQLTVGVQWVGVKATGNGFYALATPSGALRQVPDPLPSRAFTISRMTMQLRYHWEIAPLSDVFVVYTRDARLSGADGERGFGDLLAETFDETVGEHLALKFRYRFGS